MRFTRTPRLLDLFCGAGGASMGYARAGLEVIGVDINPQPHYPFEFYQADALTFPLDGFDVIHASPPCQDYSAISALSGVRGSGKFPRLIAPIRERLSQSKTLWVIENVVGASPEMRSPLLLCGTSFRLQTRRHRLFESNMVFSSPGDCRHAPGDISVRCKRSEYLGIPSGQSIMRRNGRVDPRPLYCPAPQAMAIMGVDWMTLRELGESIPPAYTQWLGGQIMRVL